MCNIAGWHRLDNLEHRSAGMLILVWLAGHSLAHRMPGCFISVHSIGYHRKQLQCKWMHSHLTTANICWTAHNTAHRNMSSNPWQQIQQVAKLWKMHHTQALNRISVGTNMARVLHETATKDYIYVFLISETDCDPISHRTSTDHPKRSNEVRWAEMQLMTNIVS